MLLLRPAMVSLTIEGLCRERVAPAAKPEMQFVRGSRKNSTFLSFPQSRDFGHGFDVKRRDVRSAEQTLRWVSLPPRPVRVNLIERTYNKIFLRVSRCAMRSTPDCDRRGVLPDSPATRRRARQNYRLSPCLPGESDLRDGASRSIAGPGGRETYCLIVRIKLCLSLDQCRRSD